MLVELAHPRQAAPVVIVKTTDKTALANSTRAILRLIAPRTPATGRNVVCLACTSGSAVMGDAFLDAGAAAYAAPAGSQFVQTSTLFAILVFRKLAFHSGTFGEAVRRARSYDEETGNWELYEREAP